MTVVVTKECSFDKIEELFRPIVPAAIAAYRQVLPADVLTDIRVAGSVPRGDARPRHSDIDFVAVCSRAPTDAEGAHLAEQARVLSSLFPQVRKVDLDVEVGQHLSEVRRFIFTTDSISVWGTNSFPATSVAIDALDLARLTTPDFDYLVSEYRARLGSAATPEAKEQASRWIGKDFLKAWRGTLLVDHGLYAKAPTNIHQLLVDHYRHRQLLWDQLLSLYLEPVADEEALHKVLDRLDGAPEKL